VKNLILLLAVSVTFGGVLYSNVPSASQGEFVPTIGSPPFLPPAPNGLLYVLYMTHEFDRDLYQEAPITQPARGYISADDFILEDNSTIENITYWIINIEDITGYVHRFWNDTGGSGPGSELAQAPATYTLTDTGQTGWGGLPVYRCDITLDPPYELDAGHYWGASWFSSGVWRTCALFNTYDYMVYFDFGGGGSGPWYSSWDFWGRYDAFFQIIEGTPYPDMDPPYVDGLDPYDGESSVPLDSDIIFHCKDDDKGVDVSTIAFIARDTSLSGSRVLGIGSSNRSIGGDLDIDDADLNDVVCTFNPHDDFYEGDTITCTVDGKLADIKGNEMGDDFVWSFTTTGAAVENTTWGAIKGDAIKADF